MKKLIVLLVCISFLGLAGCYNDAKRVFNPEYAIQEDTQLINAAFPMFPDFYRWLREDYMKSVIAINNAKPEDKRLGFNMERPEYIESINVVAMRSWVNLFTYRTGFLSTRNTDAIELNVQARESKLLELCKAKGLKVVKHKYALTKDLVSFFGEKRLTSLYDVASVEYESLYIAYDNNDDPLCMFTVITFGSSSLSGEQTDGYSMDVIIAPQRQAKSFVESQPNSFLMDTISKVYNYRE